LQGLGTLLVETCCSTDIKVEVKVVVEVIVQWWSSRERCNWWTQCILWRPRLY